MAFFKFRKAGDDSASSPRQSESIEAMRRRARHRLIGAAVLVLAGVIGFPLLFDTQPRPVAVDIPIEIPDRNKVRPLTLPRPEAQGPVTVASASPPAVVAAVPVEPPSAPEPKAQDQPAAAPTPEPVPAIAKVQPKPEPKPEPRPAAKAVSPDEGAKARALLDGKPLADTAVAAEGRFVVQVGAFADPAKARETRLRVEKVGLKTYTSVAETKDGKRIRVRVGPFASRGQADKAAEKIKGLDLPAAILTL